MRKFVVLLSSFTAVLVLVLLFTALSVGKPAAAAKTPSLPSFHSQQTSLPVSEVISGAIAYIATQQQPDGGIDAFGLGSGSNPSGSARAVLALAAAGRPAESLVYSATSQNLVDYLASQVVTFTHDITGSLFPERAGLMIAAASSANQDPTNFGSMDIVAELEASYDPTIGAYHTEALEGWTTGAANDLNQVWSILGLSSAGRPIPISATNFLLDSQAEDGSWWGGGYPDPDTTAMAVVVLIASRNVAPTDTVIQNALDYFQDSQLPSGGWRPWWDLEPLNVNSTGWVMQALATAGYTPVTASWANSEGTPRSALISQGQESGLIGGTYGNAYSTIEAVFGLTENPVFMLGRTIRTMRALTWLSELQEGDGSWSDASATTDVVLAYMAAGFDPNEIRAAGSISSSMDYLEAQAAEFASIDPARAGKLALVAATASSNPTNFGGVDLIDTLNSSYYKPSQGGFTNITGTYGITNTFFQAFPLLGLSAAGEMIPGNVKQTLLDLQQSDGGWKYDLAESAWNTTTPDNTGIALQALVAAGLPLNDTSIISATQYLRTQQDDLGGWGNANSTAYAIQGLLAIGEDLEKDWLKNGHSPYDSLVYFQKVDGPFVYQWISPWGSPPNDNAIATQQAVPALLGVLYPFTPTSQDIFIPVTRGPDPDRLLAVPPDPMYGSSVEVLIPFGSDQDQDGSVDLEWRALGAEDWNTSTTANRASGYFTLTLPITDLRSYEFRATFSDPDGVQFGRLLTDTVALISTLTAETVYLPLIQR